MDATPSGYGRRLRLPEALRPELRIPLGRLVDEASFREEVKDRDRLATVGDYCTTSALEATASPHVAVVDLRIKRKEDDRVREHRLLETRRVIRVRNPAGTLAPGAWKALEEAYASPDPVVVQVDGEEDLLALPAIALAPPGYVVAYGLPDRGAVMVDISGEARGKANGFLARMEVVNGD